MPLNNSPENLNQNEPSIATAADGTQVELGINKLVEETEKVTQMDGSAFIEAAMDLLKLPDSNRLALGAIDSGRAETFLRDALYDNIESKRQMVKGYLELKKNPGTGKYMNTFYDHITRSEAWDAHKVRQWLDANRAIHEMPTTDLFSDRDRENLKKYSRDLNQVARPPIVIRWTLVEPKVRAAYQAGKIDKGKAEKFYGAENFATMSDAMYEMEDHFRYKDVDDTEATADAMFDSLPN